MALEMSWVGWCSAEASKGQPRSRHLTGARVVGEANTGKTLGLRQYYSDAEGSLVCVRGRDTSRYGCSYGRFYGKWSLLLLDQSETRLMVS